MISCARPIAKLGIKSDVSSLCSVVVRVKAPSAAFSRSSNTSLSPPGKQLHAHRLRCVMRNIFASLSPPLCPRIRYKCLVLLPLTHAH